MLHHPLEAQGVDFWWMDWQHGAHSLITGVDPLWMLNHFHFLDAARGGDRPLLLSRYAGPGSHRYPVGFSGDVYLSWESLAFQPEFTSTASNMGYGWWSHDVGGHMFGSRDDELTARWVQFGVYSPILRLHSTANPFLAKEPWAFPAETRAALGDALRLRVRLVPYLHAMNHRAASDDVPLVLPLYYSWSERHEAYTGAQRVPVRQRTARGAHHRAPRPGHPARLGHGVASARRVDRHPHRRRRAGRPHGRTAPQSRLDSRVAGVGRHPPALRRGGDGCRGQPVAVRTCRRCRRRRRVHPHRGRRRAGGGVVRTTIRWNQERGRARHRARRRSDGIVPTARTWTVTFLGLGADEVTGADVTPRGATVTVAGDVRSALIVATTSGPEPHTHGREERLFAMLNAAQYLYEDKAEAWKIITSGRAEFEVFADLHALGLPPALMGALAEQLAPR